MLVACFVMVIAIMVTPAAAQDRGDVVAAERVGVSEAAAPGGALEAILFYAVGGMAVVSTIGVCLSQNIVRMATWLFLALGAVALIYFMLASNFLGAIQLIVYVGGTLILLVFGIMLTSKSPWTRFEPRVWETLAAGAVCLALFITLCTVLGRGEWNETETVVAGTSVADLGRSLMSTYVVPFEIAGVLLMIVMVGAAHMARQDSTDS